MQPRAFHQPRSFYVGLALVACMLAIIALVPTTGQDVAMLERLAPRVERAQALAPDARDAIARLVERARSSVVDPRDQERRELAIKRITAALDAKDGLANVGQSTPAMAPTLTSSP